MHAEKIRGNEFNQLKKEVYKQLFDTANHGDTVHALTDLNDPKNRAIQLIRDILSEKERMAMEAAYEESDDLRFHYEKMLEEAERRLHR